jgi:hypothetical protein
MYHYAVKLKIIVACHYTAELRMIVVSHWEEMMMSVVYQLMINQLMTFASIVSPTYHERTFWEPKIYATNQ